MKYILFALLLYSHIAISQDSTDVSTTIPAMSQIVQDSTGFRVLQIKERANYQDGFNVRHSQLLDSTALELYLYGIALNQLSGQEDSTRFNELSDAYTLFTNMNIIDVRRIRILGALQGSWTITRISDNQKFEGTFNEDQFSIGVQVGIVTIETSRSIKIVGLNIGNLYLDAIDKDNLRSRNGTYLFTRN